VKTKLGCLIGLRARGDCQKSNWARPEPCTKFADLSVQFRETPILEGFSNFSDEIQMPNPHPVESIDFNGTALMKEAKCGN